MVYYSNWCYIKWVIIKLLDPLLCEFKITINRVNALKTYVIIG